MELESEDGSKIPIEFGSEIQIGRDFGLGFGPSADDRTVSRRHLLLRLINDSVDKFRVGFEVIGRNPVWVRGRGDGGGRIYKNSEKGELRTGDTLSLSLKKPSFWVVKQRGGENGEDKEKRRILDDVEKREMRTVERRIEKQERVKEAVFEVDDNESEIGSVDVSHIDPVMEFGFIVKGHDFDQYPKKKILDPSNWNWFLEETADNNDDDDDDDDETVDEAGSSRRKKLGMRKKKKVGKDDDDSEWTGDSEEENASVVKGGSTKRPKYSTRSKDPKRPRKDASGARKSSAKKDANVLKNKIDEEDETEDEEDETLGGFIVNDEEEGGEYDDEESEEEFDDEVEEEDEEE